MPDKHWRACTRTLSAQFEATFSSLLADFSSHLSHLLPVVIELAAATAADEEEEEAEVGPAVKLVAMAWLEPFCGIKCKAALLDCCWKLANFQRINGFGLLYLVGCNFGDEDERAKR